LDSSSVFCLAETLKRRRPISYPHILGVSHTSPAGSASDESAFLTDIERQYGVAINRLPVSPGGPLNGSRAAVWHVEAPFLDEMWTTTHTLFSTAHGHGARVLLTGHWADQIFFDQAYLVDRFYDLAWGEVRAHWDEFARWFSDCDAADFRHRFFVDLVKYSLPGPLVSFVRSLRVKPDRPWYTGSLRRRARRYTFAALPSARALRTAHARALYEQVRSSRHVFCMEWDNKVAAMHGLEMAFPFLDRDLVSFLMRIPGELQTWQGVPKGLLREALRDVLPEAIAQRNWKADFTDFLNQGVARDYSQMIQSLRSDAMAVKSGYLREDMLKAELDQVKDRLRGESCDTARGLSDLVGLELWLQTFFRENNNGQKNSQLPESRAVVTAQGGTK